MPGARAILPPELARFSGLYRFIAPERFDELGIDAEDVPLGTFPAEDHPPFLPDRFGGNAYGLGLYEHSALPAGEAEFLDQLDFTDPGGVAPNYRRINDVFKRLGLLIRFTREGRPFYLIPRQFVAHFLVEVQAQAEEIVSFLSGLLARRLRETMRVALVCTDSELLLPEVSARMPHLDFVVIDSLAALTAKRQPVPAMVMVDDPREFAFASSPRPGWQPPREPRQRENYGYFVASRLYDLLEEGGELAVFADIPLGGSREYIKVHFSGQGEFKRFLVFSHVYRTRRRYQSRDGLTMEINKFDFNAFLAGLGVYHETVEGLLGGRSLPQVSPAEIDDLPYQDIPLPRGSANRMLNSWQRWFSPFFDIAKLTTILPETQRRDWEARYEIEGDFPATQAVLMSRKKRPPVLLEEVERRMQRRHLAGCDRALLAGYKDSFTYASKVLDVLEKVREGDFPGLPGLELSRLRKPFDTAHRHLQMADVTRLMDLAPRLARMEGRLNPDALMGPNTPVLGNLEKLALMGMEEGPLQQLYLIVLGHSTMTRVTFGKLPETTLRPLTDLVHYRDLEEAVTIMRLYRLLSVCEAAAASSDGLTDEQVAELFALYDDAIRVVTDPELDWLDILNSRILQAGGVQAKATRKMLKLFNLFDWLNNWSELLTAGPRHKEALADYDPAQLARIQEVIDLVSRMRTFINAFYAGDSSTRPFFFRALLNSELHGTGRLLPSLGAAAGFTLLWICIHASERRLVNFNRLLQVGRSRELPRRLAKLRRALLSLGADQLSPAWLTNLRGVLAEGGEAYVLGSGIYLTLDPETGALIPDYVDAEEELFLLKQDIALTRQEQLSEVPAERLQAMDRRLHQVGRFAWALAALGDHPESARRLERMAPDQTRLAHELEDYLLDQLFNLPRFAEHLRRLMRHCPRLMERIVPQLPGGTPLERRLAAADKLSALQARRVELFQDMQQSHEAARSEFGPNAAGIVGVAPLQFQSLAAALSQLQEKHPRLIRLLMLAILLRDPGQPTGPGGRVKVPLLRGIHLGREDQHDLEFLLTHHQDLWEVIDGKTTLADLQPILDCQDPPLVECLFLLGVITCGARWEGLLTEDLLERFFGLHKKIRALMRDGATAQKAQEDLVEDLGRRYLAFTRYRDLQSTESPALSLRYLLETTQIPAEERERWLKEGVRQAGLDRLLHLRGLNYVSWLDLLMLLHDVPVAYIYRLKGLRSMGVTHFERDLYEGLRLHRGLTSLDLDCQQFLLEALADPLKPVRVVGFEPAAERLTYPNQARLLLVGLAAALYLDWGLHHPPEVSFRPLVSIIGRKFEMVNQAVTTITPGALVRNLDSMEGLVDAASGLSLHFDPERACLELNLIEDDPLDHKVEALLKASDVGRLKMQYHQELAQLEVTSFQRLEYQRRLDAAFAEAVERLGEEMMERVRQEMAAEEDLDALEAIFSASWEDGLELPLSQENQQSLRDLYEMNVDRLRARYLDDVLSRLVEIRSLEDLEAYWDRVKDELKARRRHLSKDFDLQVADRFDERAKELRIRRPPTL